MASEVIDLDAVDEEEAAFLRLLEEGSTQQEELTGPGQISTFNANEPLFSPPAEDHRGVQDGCRRSLSPDPRQQEASTVAPVQVGQRFATRKAFEEACRAVLKRDNPIYNGSSVILRSNRDVCPIQFICDGRGGPSTVESYAKQHMLCSWRVCADVTYDSRGQETDLVVTGFSAAGSDCSLEHSEHARDLAMSFSSHPMMGTTYSRLTDFETAVQAISNGKKLMWLGSIDPVTIKHRSSIYCCLACTRYSQGCPFRVRMEKIADRVWRVCYVFAQHDDDCEPSEMESSASESEQSEEIPLVLCRRTAVQHQPSATAPSRLGLRVGMVFSSRRDFDKACRAELVKGGKDLNGCSVMVKKGNTVHFVCDGLGGPWRVGYDSPVDVCSWSVQATPDYDFKTKETILTIRALNCAHSQHPRIRVESFSSHPWIGLHFQCLAAFRQFAQSQLGETELFIVGSNNPDRFATFVCSHFNSQLVRCPLRIRLERIRGSDEWYLSYVHPKHSDGCPYSEEESLDADTLSRRGSRRSSVLQSVSEGAATARASKRNIDAPLQEPDASSPRRSKRLRSSSPDLSEVSGASTTEEGTHALLSFLEIYLTSPDLAAAATDLAEKGISPLLLPSLTGAELKQICTHEAPYPIRAVFEEIARTLAFRLDLPDEMDLLDEHQVRRLLKSKQPMHVVTTLHPALASKEVSEAFKRVELEWSHFAAPPDEFGEMVWLATEDVEISLTARVLLRLRLPLWKDALDALSEH